MKAKNLLIGLLLGLVATSVWGQDIHKKNKYWVFFTDKNDTQHLSPSDFLSPKALERRSRQGIAIDQKDYPVSAAYVNGIAEVGAAPLHASKWFNATSAEMDAETAAEVAALPFVRKVQPIKMARLDYEPVTPTRIGYEPGHTERQLQMLGLDVMHQNGYNGTGVTIAVMDNGFVDADQNLFLEHLFVDDRVVATYDFVNNEEDVYNQGSHGTWVLSIIAGWYENVYDSLNFYGSAHGASFILCHTEDDGSETTREEDNWIAAAEFSDSAGADILSTSLGYLGMTDIPNGYTLNDMDGNTTIITRGADIAASRGLIVVNSAGNSGSLGAGSVTAPADGDSVIAVGAVTETGSLAGFSSQGPTADGRLKPDIVAMGFLTGFVSTGSGLTRGNGTSFSCPLISGLIACVLQAQPNTGNMEMYRALIESGDHFDNPTNQFGYGIPNGPTMMTRLGYTGSFGFPQDGTLDENGGFIFPNPVILSDLNVVYDNEWQGFDGSLDIYNMQGRRVFTQSVRVDPFYNVFRIESPGTRLLPGSYVVRLQRTDQRRPVMSKKLLIFN